LVGVVGCGVGGSVHFNGFVDLIDFQSMFQRLVKITTETRGK
jgi:hypothetical protein